MASKIAPAIIPPKIPPIGFMLAIGAIIPPKAITIDLEALIKDIIPCFTLPIIIYTMPFKWPIIGRLRTTSFIKLKNFIWVSLAPYRSPLIACTSEVI